MSRNPFPAPFLLLVLQLLIKVQSNCYNELGCFPMTYPWVSPLRPLPSPQPPWTIDVHLYLWTRSRPTRQYVTLWPAISLNGTDYHPGRPRTVFIAHGFVSDGDMGWIDRMKNAYLDRVDANIFITDWGKGAKKLSYLQAASNIRIVGAELARFGKYLANSGLNKSKFHLIGHSLGAHVMSYMAKGLINNGSKVGRITGLDPAQPGFEGTPSTVRLTIEDADFIDVLHTDARPFIPFLGFGMLRPLGHVDFYVNGGSGQPGCLTVNVKPVNSITDLIDIPMEILLHLVSCSHLRSYDIFIAALSNNCTIWGRKLPLLESFIMLSSLGTLAFPETRSDGINSCSLNTCSVVGLKTPEFPSRGSFLTYTSAYFPYCETKLRDEDLFLLTRKLSSISGGISNSLKSIFFG